MTRVGLLDTPYALNVVQTLDCHTSFRCVRHDDPAEITASANAHVINEDLGKFLDYSMHPKPRT